MFYSARKKLPAVDYVSVVRSLYADGRSMLYGMVCAAIAAGAAAHGADSLALWVICGLFLIFGVARYLDMRAFAAADISGDDAEAAEHWEIRNTLGSVSVAALHGFWCLFSLTAVDGGFAAFSSAVVTMASVTGIANRNFAVDRLVTLQLLFITVPFGLGLFLLGDMHHAIIAVLLILFMAGIRRMATKLRLILLNAVHGRVEANRLASQFDAALATMTHGLLMLDSDGRVAVVNAQAQVMFAGLAAQRSIGRPLLQVILEARRDQLITPQLARRFVKALARGSAPRKFVAALPDGRQCEVTISAREGRTVVVFEDITERVVAEQRITYMARYDGLTGLPNRSYFTETAEAELGRRRQARSREAVAVVMIDIDDFKHVNDTFGHPVGDALLAEAARRVRAAAHEKGMVARFGGDEFTIFRAGGVTRRNVEREAAAILGVLRQPFDVLGHVIRAHASIGVVVGSAEDDLATLLTRADLALYQAKGNGKGRWSLFHDVMDVDYRHRQRLKSDLRDAIAGGELSLAYQPIVRIQDRRIIGCEALARWHHKELGPISPAVFIPIAEEIGVISDLSRWVLNTAARECAAWPEALMVSVNLSATDFRMTNVAQMVEEGLAASGLPAHRLEVEITESTLIEEKDAVVEALGHLGRRGVGIALDDFGTGYSSLSYLHALPFSKLKIDRSFVIDVVENPRSLQLLHNIARLAKDLAMKVTVEGIETEEQLEAITNGAEVDQAQGYLFGPPLPRREIGEIIARMVPPAKPAARASCVKA